MTDAAPNAAPDAVRVAAPRGDGLSTATLLRYAAGSVGTGGFATLPGLVLLYYLTDALAVPAAAAGAIVAGAKVWDVLVAPFVGAASDRDLARTGSRRRVMTVGAVVLPFAFALTFAAPGAAGPTAAALWVLVAFLLATTAYALFQVPFIALPAELTDSYDGRTRLLAWRVAVLAVAILAFGAGGPALRGETDSLGGYRLMGIVAAVVIGLGLLVATRAAGRPRRGAPDATAPGPAAPDATASRGGTVAATGRRAWRDAVAVVRTSAPFRALLTAFFLQAMATGLMLAGAQYVAKYLLDSTDAVTYLFVALIAPALVFMPVWTRLSARRGKEWSFRVATVLFAVATVAMVPLAWAPGAWIYGPTALAGIAYAGMQALPMAMLADVISHDSATSGGRGGAFSGVWTAGETTGLALGPAILSIVLAVAGYRSSAADAVVAQTASAHAGIALAFSAIPALLTIASLFALLQYGLRRADVDAAGPTAA